MKTKFGIGDSVKTLDTSDHHPNGKWAHGIVTAIADRWDEGFEVQWDDMELPIDYEWQNCDDILPDNGDPLQDHIQKWVDENLPDNPVCAVQAIEMYVKYQEKLQQQKAYVPTAEFLSQKELGV